MRDLGTYRQLALAALGAAALGMAGDAGAAGLDVVTHGRFTNIYVYPTPDTETWEQHMTSLRPGDAGQFSRASIDRFVHTLLDPAWPSYSDALFQYHGIHPPRFAGSGVANQRCVDAALKDAVGGVIQRDTIRSLANCHTDGLDPSPQVNLIFSPDIPVARMGSSGDICTTTNTLAYHARGINTPNFTVLTTSPNCFPTFSRFTSTMSHEIVETISNPGGTGVGDPGGANELSDRCSSSTMTWNGYTVQRYWSDFDNGCQPQLDPPPGSVSTTWILGEGAPLGRLSGRVHELALRVPASHLTTSAPVTQALLVIKTGGDDLHGGNDPRDNVDVILRFAGGGAISHNINRRRSWSNGETHSVLLRLPAAPPSVGQIEGVTIRTGFHGGDNWDIDKVALIVSYPAGSTTSTPPSTVLQDWLDASGAPLMRFTGGDDRRTLTRPVAASDPGRTIRALEVVITTGNDDLRGGSNPGDNCEVTVELTSGARLRVTNANAGRTWEGWTTHRVPIPLAGRILHGSDIASVTLRTRFGGGVDGDNWNVNRLQLRATVE